MSIGKRISEIRKSEGLSQEDFGKRIGLSRSIIGCYEKDINEGCHAAIVKYQTNACDLQKLNWQ